MTLQDTVDCFSIPRRIREYSRIIKKYILETTWNIAIVLFADKKYYYASVCGKSKRQNTSRRNSCSRTF